MARLSLRLLGSFQVTLYGEPVFGFKSNKIRALLAYLAVEAARPHSREILASLLWPELTDRTARANLRTALYDLRLNIGDKRADPPHLLVSGDTIQFNKASDSWLDVDAFKWCLSDDRHSLTDPESWLQAIELYQGPFLDGFSLNKCLAFEEWAMIQREVLERKMISALDQLAACYESRGQVAEAEAALRQQLQLDPLDEAVHRRLMRLLDTAGRRTHALTQYRRCQKILAETLAIKPLTRTRRLYKRIRDSDLITEEGARTGWSGIFSMPSPSSAVTPLTPATPFVGFEKEMARLNHTLAQALAGKGQVVFVTGESGRGKTMLLAECCRRALKAHDQLLVAAGRCDAQHGYGDPYQPFREALRILSGSVESTHAWRDVYKLQGKHLKRAMPVVLQVLAKHGPDLVGPFLHADTLVRLAEEVWAPGDPWRLRLEALAAHQGVGPGRIAPGRSSDTNTANSVAAAQTKSAATGPPLDQVALFDQVTRVLQYLSTHHPLILALDDLQWVDPGSASLLFHLARRLEGYRILVIGAYRPVEVTLALGRPAHASGRSERHPLASILHEIQRDFGQIQIDLNGADGRLFVEALLDCEPNRLDGGFKDHLYQRTGGHPLFTVELLRGLQDRGELVKDGNGQWIGGRQLDWAQLPARVEAVIAERFRRLSPLYRSILIEASVQGQDFIADVVAQAQSSEAQTMIDCLSDQEWKQHRLVQAVGTEQYGDQRVTRFRFRHELVRQYAYRQMDPVTKGGMHERTAIALEALYAGHIEDHALELGGHFEAAERAEKAAGYFLLAGKRAYLMSANKAAIDHFHRGLDLLASQPETTSEEELAERVRLELALQLALGAPLRAGEGFAAPEVVRVYARARDLARQVGDIDRLFTAQLLLWTTYLTSAQYQRAHEAGIELYDLAKVSQDASQLAQANLSLGMVRLYLGEFKQALDHLEAVIADNDPGGQALLISPVGQDVRIASLISSARLLWFLGYPEMALRRSQEAITQTKALEHPYSLALALGLAGCLVHLLRREYGLVQEQAEALLGLTFNEKFRFHEAWGRLCLGRAQVANWQVIEGRANLRQGLAVCQEIGHKSNATFNQALLAEACATVEDGLGVLAEAEEIMAKTGERFYEAEINRLRGELLLQQGDDGAAAEVCFQQALAIAQQQEAKSLELRAAMSLTRLWWGQGRAEKARALLANVYDWFTEGFDTADLQEAQGLLEEFKRY